METLPERKTGLLRFAMKRRANPISAKTVSQAKGESDEKRRMRNFERKVGGTSFNFSLSMRRAVAPGPRTGTPGSKVWPRDSPRDGGEFPAHGSPFGHGPGAHTGNNDRIKHSPVLAASGTRGWPGWFRAFAGDCRRPLRKNPMDFAGAGKTLLFSK